MLRYVNCRYARPCGGCSSGRRSDTDFLKNHLEFPHTAAGISLTENAHRFRIEAVGTDLAFESVIDI